MFTRKTEAANMTREARLKSSILDVARIRDDFPIFSRLINGRRLAYVDSAATSQKPRRVIDAEAEFYESHYANVHRGVYTLAEEATEFYERARAKVAGFLHLPDPANFIFTRGTTESINLVAYAWGRKFLKKGDEILLTEMEHHSNIVPWQLCARDTGARVRYIPLTEDGLLDMDDLDSLLTPRTKIVGITGASNTLGTLTPLSQVIEAAHAVNALVCVDAAQLVPHMQVDVSSLDCDFLAFSGHKMLGPTASGGLYGRPELLEAMDPFLSGGHMIREVFHEFSTWDDVPYKFEAGTMQLAQQVGLGAAIDYLQNIGMDNVRAHEIEITNYALERLLDVGAMVLGPLNTENRGSAISFLYKEIHPHDLAAIADQEGVAVRAGHHCAKLVMRRFRVQATTRASFYVYNSHDDVDALIRALERAASIFRP